MIEKIALTGAPGSGKSSILLELETAYGERIIREAAEDIIKLMKAKGDKEPWKKTCFQDYILAKQMCREEQTEQLKGRVFIDRGILDGLAYYQLQGRTPTDLMKLAIKQTRNRYKRVFLIELGNSCEKTEIRREDLEEAKNLERLQYENYTKAGYEVERIPYLTVEERARRIIGSLWGAR